MPYGLDARLGFLFGNDDDEEDIFQQDEARIRKGNAEYYQTLVDKDAERSREGPYGASRAARRTLSSITPGEGSYGAALSQTSLAGGIPQPTGQDIVKSLITDTANRRDLLRDLIYFGGFGSGAGGQINKLLQRKPPSFLDLLSVNAAQGGSPTTLFPVSGATGIGTGATNPGYGREFRLVPTPQGLQGAFVERGKLDEIKKFLDDLGGV